MGKKGNVGCGGVCVNSLRKLNRPSRESRGKDLSVFNPHGLCIFVLIYSFPWLENLKDSSRKL